MAGMYVYPWPHSTQSGDREGQHEANGAQNVENDSQPPCNPRNTPAASTQRAAGANMKHEQIMPLQADSQQRYQLQPCHAMPAQSLLQSFLFVTHLAGTEGGKGPVPRQGHLLQGDNRGLLHLLLQLHDKRAHQQPSQVGPCHTQLAQHGCPSRRQANKPFPCASPTTTRSPGPQTLSVTALYR